MKYLVTGATGQLGSLIVDRLLKTAGPHELAVSVRDKSKAGEIEALGIDVREADFKNPESLVKAFAGTGNILIVSPNVTGEEAIRQHRAAIDAAKVNGARRVLYTSHVGSSLTSAFLPMRSHAAAETYLESSGLNFTALRNGFYSESALMFLKDALTTSEINLPEDGPVSWTAHVDLADAAAKMLIDANGEIKMPRLTASEALDFSAIAEILSELVGQKIRRNVISDEKFKRHLAARGTPEPVIQTLTGIFEASRLGEFNIIDPHLERILGRKPLSLRRILENHVSVLTNQRGHQ